MAEVWVVDDEPALRWVLEQALRDSGHEVKSFDSVEEALPALLKRQPDVLFTDVRMPGESGLSLLETVGSRWPELPVVVMSAYAGLPETVAAFGSGAFDVLAKPFDLDQAVALVDRSLAKLRHDDGHAEADMGDPDLIGETPAMREVFRAIGRLARTDLSVLITGETGTGKELVARALHRHSPRAGKPFIALNTAAIPAELLESELFGHEAGAFTGAQRRQVGRFEQAQGGTLFLDEIGDMPERLQTRLLRVLAEGEFFRLGGRELIEVDVRVVAATHQDLETAVEAGRFRADLLHRLDVVRIHLPPLRERRADVPRLAERFLAQAIAELKLEPKRFSADALKALAAQDWPGNVRQLENLCQRVAVMAPGREIALADLPFAAQPAAPVEAWSQALANWAEAELAREAPDIHARARATLDRTLLQTALAATGGHRQQAAEKLGVGRNTLTRKLGASRKRRAPQGE
jgi:two-component system, NtrC family, nitrogen regulation response regulator GlnG